MRGNRTAPETEAPSTITVPAEAKTEETKQETPATTETRSPRPALNVGEVKVRASTRSPEELTTRPSRISSDPVYLAVQGADFDAPTDLDVDPDKVEAVKKRLRSASDPSHLNVGMTIVPGHPKSPEDETKVVVTFIKRKERQVRKAKGASEGNGASE